MTYIHKLTILLIGATSLAVAAPAAAQRQTTAPASEAALPLCRLAEPGEQCRTRNGDIRTRRGHRGGNAPDAPATNNLGTNDPGWEFRERPVSQESSDGSRTLREVAPAQFGGEDIGFATGGNGTAPEPEAMECEFCDDDEDEPQGPIDNTPRPNEPTTSEPEEEDDCDWHNPAGGPDQEFCDE